MGFRPIEYANTLSTNIGPNGYRNIKATLSNQSDLSLNIFMASNDGFKISQDMINKN